MKTIAGLIMKGRIQAVLFASLLALLSLKIPPFSIFSSAAIALVTLRRGGLEGLYVMLIAGVSSALVGAFQFDNFQFVLLYSMVLWLPVWFFAFILREGRQLILTIQLAVLIGMLGVIGFYLFHPDPAQMWLQLMMQLMQNLSEAMGVPLEQQNQAIGSRARVMTGVVAAAMVFSMMFGLFLGRWWQALLYNPGGFRSEFLSIKVNPVVSFVALAVVLTALLMQEATIGEISSNLMILFFVLYSIVGTAVAHVVFASMKNKKIAVPFFYITLVLIPQVTIAIAVFGLADSWINLRGKISNNTIS